MPLLRRCDHLLQAQHFANVLRAAGIACELRNIHSASAFGELPLDQCMPQLWVSNRLETQRARDILDSLKRPFEGNPWRCRCNELIEPQFGTCWQCGAAAPDTPGGSGQPTGQ
jgi:hypothetical protein